MIQVIKQWCQRHFYNPEVATLWLTLLGIILLFIVMGHVLTPLFVSIVIAYLLDGLVGRLVRWRCPHVLSVSLVCLLFLGLLIIALLVILPLLWQQLSNLLNELPNMLSKGEVLLMQLPQHYPEYISAAQISSIIAELNVDFARFGKVALGFAVSSIPGIMEIIIYFVLIPILVFFLLKDRDDVLTWGSRFLPKKRRLVVQVWGEVNTQIGNYIRGRIVEIIIVSMISAITFGIMGLRYALLLGALVGVSVIVPYIGAIIATVPIVILAILQWGLSAHFVYLLIAYAVIIALDANLLVPLLFSETMNIHPLAIIMAVVIFGGLLGFWGVFFAIPLATVVNAILKAVPGE